MNRTSAITSGPMVAPISSSALFSPYVLNYAPKEQRFGHIIKRLEKIPALFEQAKANLIDSPEVWNRVAREENEALKTRIAALEAKLGGTSS